MVLSAARIFLHSIVLSGLVAMLMAISGLVSRCAAAMTPAPTPSGIYTPKAELSGAHPRWMLPTTPIATLRARAADPAYADIWQDILAKAATAVPTTVPNATAEDPWRPYGDTIPFIAVAYLADPDPTARSTHLTNLLKWLDTATTWGVPQQDLSLSHMIIGMATVYDWLYNDPNLPAATRAKVRTYLIDMTRWLVDPANTGAAQWRGREYQANHNWWNHAALAMVAVALWGDTATPLGSSEASTWLDTAMTDFWYVRQQVSTDGSPLEGYFYGEYGNRPLLLFGIIADTLTTTTVPFVDYPAVRLKGGAKLHCLIPKKYGFLNWADGYPRSFNGISHYHYLAARFRDGDAQLLAQTSLANGGAAEWKSLFWYDTTLAAPTLSKLPLFRDNPDVGTFLARSDWNDANNPTLFAFKCGPAPGDTSVRVSPPGGITSGHTQPDEGNVTLYYANSPILPSAGYLKTKWAGAFNLPLFDGIGTQAGTTIGQAGGGGQWFANAYSKTKGHARTLEVVHNANYHAYLADIGTLYPMTNAAGATWKPDYLRRVVYAPPGVLIIADKITPQDARTIHCRMPTYANNMTLSGNVFSFTTRATGSVGTAGIPCTITDATSGKVTRAVKAETLDAWDHAGSDGEYISRNTAEITMANTTSAVFVTILRINGAGSGVTAIGTTSDLTITGLTGGTLTLPWPGANAVHLNPLVTVRPNGVCDLRGNDRPSRGL